MYAKEMVATIFFSCWRRGKQIKIALVKLIIMARNIDIRSIKVKKICHPKQKCGLFQNPGRLRLSQVKATGGPDKQVHRSTQLIAMNKMVGTFLIFVVKKWYTARVFPNTPIKEETRRREPRNLSASSEKFPENSVG